MIVHKTAVIGKSGSLVFKHAEDHLIGELADLAPHIETLPAAEFQMKVDEAGMRTIKRIMADAVHEMMQEQAKELVSRALCNQANMANETWRRKGKRRGQGWCSS